MPKTFSYGDTAPEPKDVKNTRMLEPGGRETRGQNEKNSLKRQTTTNKTPQKGGATGHP